MNDMDIKTLQEIPPWEWPEQAGRVLIETITDRDSDPADRLIATELAGDYVVLSDDVARVLLNIVRDDQEAANLRGTAVISLGPALEHADMMEFEDEDDILITQEMFSEIMEQLQQLYMRDDLPHELRRRILEAAVRAPRPWHHEAVQSAFEKDDADWRRTAVFCMGYVGGFDQQILQSLENSDPLIHYHAVFAAGNWEIEEAWSHIADLIRSEGTDKDLLIAAISAAAAIKPEEASMVLGDLIESDDEDIAEAALEALALAEGLEGFDLEDFGEFDDEK
jgi:HEAT repeat protein